MDGTFLDSSKRFSMEFFDIFEELRKRKIKFVIASGNQYFRLYQKFLQISNEMYFIGENGSYIAKGVKLIATNTLKKEQVQAVDRKSTRLNSSHSRKSRMPSSA